MELAKLNLFTKSLEQRLLVGAGAVVFHQEPDQFANQVVQLLALPVVPTLQRQTWSPPKKTIFWSKNYAFLGYIPYQ